MSLGPRHAHIPAADASSIGTRLAGGLQAPRPNRISLKDDRFTLIMESGQPNPSVPPALSIQVIFVGSNSHASRVYYDSDTYDADNPDAPVCWSDNGVGPSEKSSQPQAPTCGQCPKAVWGSAVSKMTGKGIPACAGRKKVAVLVAGAGNEVFLLDIPGGSTKAFGHYLAHLVNDLHAAPEGVVTKLTMINKELVFEDAMWVPEAMLPQITQIVNSGAPDLVVNEHDRPVQARLSGPAPQPRIGTFAPKPQQPSTEMQPNRGFDLMYPKGPVASQYQHDERNPPPPPEPSFAPPMTAQEAEAANSGKPRKPRSDKGVPRKGETVIGAGPIPPQTFAAPPPATNPPQQFIGQPLQPSPQQQPFIGQPLLQPSFGMNREPQPAPEALDDAISRAFGLRVGN